MTKIFISGSRQIPALPTVVQGELDDTVENDFKVLIGDSEKGVDSLVAQYFKQQGYKNVSIYSISSESRIKDLPNEWTFMTINPEIDTKYNNNGERINGRELQTYKDRAMGDECDCGLLIWQDTYTNRFGKTAVSAGSLRNMVQLLLNKKTVHLYYGHEGDSPDEFSSYELSSVDELSNIIEEIDKSDTSRVCVEKYEDGNLVRKFQDGIIKRQYNDILKKELKIIEDARSEKQEAEQGTLC